MSNAYGYIKVPSTVTPENSKENARKCKSWIHFPSVRRRYTEEYDEVYNCDPAYIEEPFTENDAWNSIVELASHMYYASIGYDHYIIDKYGDIKGKIQFIVKVQDLR